VFGGKCVPAQHKPHTDDQSIDPGPTYRLTHETLQLPSILQGTSYCVLHSAKYAEWKFRSTGHKGLVRIV
jgi:hypothetical protein